MKVRWLVSIIILQEVIVFDCYDNLGGNAESFVPYMDGRFFSFTEFDCYALRVYFMKQQGCFRSKGHRMWDALRVYLRRSKARSKCIKLSTGKRKNKDIVDNF